MVDKSRLPLFQRGGEFILRLLIHIDRQKPHLKERINEINVLWRYVDDLFVHQRHFNPIHVSRCSKIVRSQSFCRAKLNDFAAQRSQEINLWIREPVHFSLE